MTSESLGARVRRVVLVDIRPERRAVMRVMIEHALGQGSVVAEVAATDEAVAAVDRCLADVAVVEVQLPIARGLEVVAALRAAHRSLRIVVCSFHQDTATQRQTQDAGADDYLVKPVNTRDLRRSLEGALPVPPAAVRPVYADAIAP